jgi:hypothetical protein
MRIVARKPTGTTLPEEKERYVERANINNISTAAKEGTDINCLEIGIRPPTPSRKSAIMPAETHLFDHEGRDHLVGADGGTLV